MTFLVFMSSLTRYHARVISQGRHWFEISWKIELLQNMNLFLALVFCLNLQTVEMAELLDEYDFAPEQGHHRLDFRSIASGKSLHTEKKRNYFTTELWKALSPHV